MNIRNEWQNLLKIANEDLGKIGYSLLITEGGDGYYNCEIWEDGELVEVFAENYFENELSDLVTEAWHYTNYILNRN